VGEEKISEFFFFFSGRGGGYTKRDSSRGGGMSQMKRASKQGKSGIDDGISLRQGVILMKKGPEGGEGKRDSLQEAAGETEGGRAG